MFTFGDVIFYRPMDVWTINHCNDHHGLADDGRVCCDSRVNNSAQHDLIAVPCISQSSDWIIIN